MFFLITDNKELEFYSSHSPFIFLITRHGFPTATQFAGISFVTTLPAPITVPSPIDTPGRMIAPPPIQHPLPIFTGKAYVRQKYSPLSGFQSVVSLSASSTGCVAVYICTLEAIKTLLPISILLQSTNVQFILIDTFVPIIIFFP